MNTSPGFLINARGRDWVIQSGSTENLLCLRPLTGSDDEAVYIVPSLEREEIKDAVFPEPDPEKNGNTEEGNLFRSSAMLRLRNGTGPLRCMGNIAVEPRSYQLTPLLMALKLDTIRLLIADDVGIGKTIEAGLIAKEMLDRFEIERLSVLCPSHLVSQWVSELREHFNLPAVALTASSVYSLEKKVPKDMDITECYPVTVISLDYIKNPKRRDNFIHKAPEMIIVDEAHTCTEKGGNDSHQRFELLKKLAADSSRHMIFLTATPHSGDSIAFGNLLSLLDPQFSALADYEMAKNSVLRNELSSHFVQRQRADLIQYKDSPNFAHRLTNEFSYTFDGNWKEFFESARDYCARLGDPRNPSGAIWYAILALYRCIASSPESAIHALETRLRKTSDSDDFDDTADLFDQDSADSIKDLDVTLAEDRADRKRTNDLLELAKALRTCVDPKFNCLVDVLKKQIFKADEYSSSGYTPIVFCRYISTAKYVGEKLKEAFPKKHVEVITGEQPPEEREARVMELSDFDAPILVATDCLSEGINLQNQFTAVIHYDLAWNPTRHEQREGRIDRFGQSAPYVKCIMLYGKDNPVDGLIMKVILNKAKKIRESLGILVPVPEDGKAIQQALIEATMLKKSLKEDDGQLYFDFGEVESVEEELEKPWQDAADKAKRNRTIFAQRSIHPDEVMKVLSDEKDILGSDEDTERFVITAMSTVTRSEIHPNDRHTYLLDFDHILDESLKKDASDRGLTGTLKASFRFPSPPGYTYIHRSHPLVQMLSSYAFEFVLSDYKDKKYSLGVRCSAIETSEVDELTYLYLMRIRLQISSDKAAVIKSSMAEETLLVKLADDSLEILDHDEMKKLLYARPEANLNQGYVHSVLADGIEEYRRHPVDIQRIVEARRQKLLDDTRATRAAASTTGRIEVRPCMPADLLGIYAFIPSAEDI